MSILFITGIAFSLSFDAFAVSLSNGCALRRSTWPQAVIVGLWFGIFQAGMPILGWLGGSLFRDIIRSWSHWIAFVLLAVIGIRMIQEGYRSSKGCPAPATAEILHPGRLFVLAIATSIDALAVGLSFSILGLPVTGPAIVIGVITFLMSVLGMKTGGRLYVFLEDKVEYAGGVILIMLGAKILVEHLI